MFAKFNIEKIVFAHIYTLRDEATGNVKKGDIFITFIVPVVPFLFSWCGSVKLSDAAVGAWISAFSVFAGLLFNLLILVYGVDENFKVTSENMGRAKELVRQTFVNIAFSIIVSIAIIIFLGLSFVMPDKILPLAAAVFYYLLTLFILTMMMVLKRMYVIFCIARGYEL